VKDLILSLQNHTEAIDLSIEKTKNGEPDEDHINFSLSGIYEWENLDEYTLEVDTYIPDIAAALKIISNVEKEQISGILFF
jgi:hypothetical protein